jgi:hypothetical protein
MQPIPHHKSPLVLFEDFQKALNVLESRVVRGPNETNLGWISEFESKIEQLVSEKNAGVRALQQPAVHVAVSRVQKRGSARGWINKLNPVIQRVCRATSSATAKVKAATQNGRKTFLPVPPSKLTSQVSRMKVGNSTNWCAVHKEKAEVKKNSAAQKEPFCRRRIRRKAWLVV